MFRKSLYQYSSSELPFRRGEFADIGDSIKKSRISLKAFSPREVFCIEACNIISILYGSLFIYLIINHDDFLFIGTIKSLYISIIHTVLEHLKYKVSKRFFSIKSEKELSIKDYVLMLPTYFICSCLCHFITILFGVEITVNIEATFVFSCILTSLVLIPLYYLNGIQSLYLVTLQSNPSNLLEANMQRVAYATVLGAWLGAFVIPLDWDRSWQRWPIPCIIGSLAGFVFGHLYSFTVLLSYYKK